MQYLVCLECSTILILTRMQLLTSKKSQIILVVLTKITVTHGPRGGGDISEMVHG